MKMYKKSELTLVDGLLISKDGDIVLPDVRVIDQANDLETLVQKTAYLMGQPEATPMPSLDGFKRSSIKDEVVFTASTPIMDKKIDEAMAIMDEIDDMATVEKANELIDKFKALLRFVSRDFVIDCGNKLYCFDTPTLGSILDLTKDDVVDAIAYACGMSKDGIKKHDTLMAAIPATEENLDKIKEFFDSISSDESNEDDED